MTVPSSADVPGPSGLTSTSSMDSGNYRTLGKRLDNPNVAESTAEKRHESDSSDL